MGAVCGFIGLLVGVVIPVFGASEAAADRRVSMIALIFGLALGVFVGAVVALDEFGKASSSRESLGPACQILQII
jgi:hypothetical protein